MTRAEAKQEAQRLTSLVGRDISFRTIDCGCDFSSFCEDCGGSGSFPEFFYTLCNHRVEEHDRDGECYDYYYAEREQVRQAEERIVT